MVLTPRTLTPDDAEAYAALCLEAVERFQSAFCSTPEEVQALSREAVAETLSAGMTLGLFDGETLSGMVGLRRLPFARAAHRVEIGAFYIRPALHGAGAAAQLLAAIIDHVRPLGVWQLELCVAERNARAIRFYERHGFVWQGRMPNTVIGPEGPETDLFYTRDLRG
ncbi:GNAT family N-acetyltransferase [Salipiger bermudensis]|uniref:GNAT family N-acetyltransferase n=1 Tax=Salipiger bermudensis TaxID=344736 RepID=UPI001C995299|nr:GNAT family N-acetyltransferase [Salipiger bermudensis]MBY6004374.1 GNAT family N-acetyltransferase [Salipiger bermudensis]